MRKGNNRNRDIHVICAGQREGWKGDLDWIWELCVVLGQHKSWHHHFPKWWQFLEDYSPFIKKCIAAVINKNIYISNFFSNNKRVHKTGLIIKKLYKKLKQTASIKDTMNRISSSPLDKYMYSTTWKYRLFCPAGKSQYSDLVISMDICICFINFIYIKLPFSLPLGNLGW